MYIKDNRKLYSVFFILFFIRNKCNFSKIKSKYKIIYRLYSEKFRNIYVYYKKLEELIKNLKKKISNLFQ